jgi:hypothetical protein
MPLPGNGRLFFFRYSAFQTAYHGMMIVHNELERIWREAVMGQFLEKFRKVSKSFRQNFGYPTKDSKQDF